MVTLMNSLRHDESGATAVEYALLAALISIVGVSWATFTGQALVTTFTIISDLLGSI